MEDKKKYQVLGVKGNMVEVNGQEYPAREAVVELTDEEAAEPLRVSKIALLEDGAEEAPAEDAPAEEAPSEEAPAEEEAAPAEEDAPADNGESAPADDNLGGGGGSEEENNFQG